jgi:hypothetical protein
MQWFFTHVFPFIALLWAAAGFLRILYMLIYFKSAKATVLSHEYAEADRHRDGQKPHAADPDYSRKVPVQARFTDHSGQTHLVRHKVATRYGQEPESPYELWYRINDPTHVTTRSWFYWVFITSIPVIYFLGNAYDRFAN